ncbi:MAG: hypothetical protein WC700_09060 [Gemmatimonadaceae bacterium]|jgi:hypothetical protein
MSSNTTLAQALDQANPNRIADILQKVKLGTMLTPRTTTFTPASSQKDVTLDPPALMITSVRATRGAGGSQVAGPYLVQDVGGTVRDNGGGANTPGACTLSADGTTLTFNANWSNGLGAAPTDTCIVCYVPRSYTDLTETFNITGE